MTTDLENFHATVSHQRPGRVLYHGSFVEDLQKRVVEHIGTKDIAGHYGMARSSGVGPRRPADLPPLDFARYWHGADLPPGTTINGSGVAMVPSGFYHFWGYISPLRNATSLRDIEEFPLEDYSRWDFSGMAEQVRAAHQAGRYAEPGSTHTCERLADPRLRAVPHRPHRAARVGRSISWERLPAEPDQSPCRCRRSRPDHHRGRCREPDRLIFSKDTWKRLMYSLGKVWEEIKRILELRIWYHSGGSISTSSGPVDAGLDPQSCSPAGPR